MSKKKKLKRAAARELASMAELHGEQLGTARLLGSGDWSGSSGSSGGVRSRGQGRGARLVNQAGVDVGDTVVIVIEGDGPNGTFIGTLAAIGANFVRLVTTANGAAGAAGVGGVGGGVIPVGTLLTIDINDIAAIGRVPANGGAAGL